MKKVLGLLGVAVVVGVGVWAVRRALTDLPFGESLAADPTPPGVTKEDLEQWERDDEQVVP